MQAVRSSMPAPRLVAFDVDGTLLRGRTICQCIADRVGRRSEMDAFERLTALEDIAGARAEMLAWHRGYDEAFLLDCVAEATFAPGAREGIALLKELGSQIALVSITWEFAVSWIAKKLGADYFVGTATKGSQIDHFWPEDKPVWLEDLAMRLGIDLSEVAAVGDSIGDLPMLHLVGRGVYVGADCPDLPPHVIRQPGADVLEIVGTLLA